jgi:hypothetical protein
MVMSEFSTDSTPAQPLEYRRAKKVAPHRPLIAVALCLPGLICWIALAEIVLPRWFGPMWLLPQFFGISGLLLCWAIAIICAAISLAGYRSPHKPWYVWLNLTINISGLVFTGLVVFLILWHFAFR